MLRLQITIYHIPRPRSHVIATANFLPSSQSLWGIGSLEVITTPKGPLIPKASKAWLTISGTWTPVGLETGTSASTSLALALQHTGGSWSERVRLLLLLLIQVLDHPKCAIFWRFAYKVPQDVNHQHPGPQKYAPLSGSKADLYNAPERP